MTPDRPVPAWKEQVRELVHEAILDAARATFAEHGYEGATVDEIAARADVAKGTIYNYVEGGKAGLFVAVLSAHFDALHATAERTFAKSGATLRERYQAFAAEVMAYFHAHRDLLRVHLREVPRLLVSDEGGSQADQLRVQRDRIVDVIARALAAAVAAGEARPVPTVATAHVALGLLMGYLHHPGPECVLDAPAGGDGADGSLASIPASAEFLTRLLFDGLLPAGPDGASGGTDAGPA